MSTLSESTSFAPEKKTFLKNQGSSSRDSRQEATTPTSSRPCCWTLKKTPRNTPTASSLAKTQNPKIKPTKMFTFTFHVTFHPSHPNKEVKDAWRSIVAFPPDKEPLSNLQTNVGFRIPVERFVMCYHKAHNLGSLLSYRKIDKRQGPKLSSYME